MSFFFTFLFVAMNKVSKFQKWGIISLIWLLLVGVSFAELIYNPDTGTYTDTSVEQTNDDSIWIPVTDTVVTTTTVANADQNTWDVQTMSWDNTQVVTTTETVVETTVETPVEFVEFDTTDTIIQVTDISNSWTELISFKTLDAWLKQTVSSLGQYLDQQASDLAWIYNTNIANRYGSTFGELVSCIWDDNAVSQIQQEIQNIVETLDTRIKTDAAELHAQIANLKYRNQSGLLNKSALVIESNVVSTNIEAFQQNFLSLIDHYAQWASSSIIDFVDTNEAVEYEKILASYLARKSKLDQLKQAFTAFEKWTFFGQTVVGPRADELAAVWDDIFTIFKNDMLGQRWDRAPSAFDTMIEKMRLDFDVKVEKTIESLFPYWNVEWLYTSYSSLSWIYGLGGDTYDCKAVIANKTVDKAGPLLIKNIETIQQEIAVAMSAVWWATSWGELKEWLSDILLEYYQVSLLPQFQSTYSTAETIVLSESEIIYNQYRSQVVWFLLDMRVNYIDDDNLLWFEKKLERAYTRVEKAIADGAEGRLLLILQSIGDAIGQVLKG